MTAPEEPPSRVRRAPPRAAPPRPSGLRAPAPIFTLVSRWLEEPLSLVRLELVRILAPLAILGFMSGRLAHADEWLGDAGFRVPELGVSDWRQPFYVPSLPSWVAWSIAVSMVGSGLAVALGWRTRKSALVFALTLAFVALSDRLSAFTVSKLSPVLMLALAASPSGARLSIDAWLARRKEPTRVPPALSRGTVRFFQVLLVVIYSGSGIAKARGDWLHDPFVLWSHLHDSYQTAFAVVLANALPAWAWIVFQALILVFEVGAPVLFALPQTRTLAFAFGMGMHLMIGLCFGPVKWFAMLMGSLLVGAYLPEPWLARLEALVDRWEAPAVPAPAPPHARKRRRPAADAPM